MIRIEKRVETINESRAVLHRRLITPLFFKRLRPVRATFREIRSEWLRMPFCDAKLPNGKIKLSGYWEDESENRLDMPELLAVREPYYIITDKNPQ